MLKYVTTMVTFEEIPTEVTLSFSISNCQNRCPGCHSPELRCDIGKELTMEKLDELIQRNSGISAVLFLGEGNDSEWLKMLANHVRDAHNLKSALYSGRDEVEDDIYECFDYVKIGSYRQELGALNNVNTNQRLYRIINGQHEDITHYFWKKK